MTDDPESSEHHHPMEGKPRRLVLFQGGRDFEVPEQLLAADANLRAVWISRTPGVNTIMVDPQHAGKLLGREFDLVIYDASEGIDPDVLGIVSGCIPAGGVLILRIPPLQEAIAPWNSPYHQRFQRLLGSRARVESVDSLDGLCVEHSMETRGRDWMSRDQALAVSAVSHVLSGGRKRPAILVADRGRGKSAALGIAAAQVIQDPDRKVVVSGRSRTTADNVFQHATSGRTRVDGRVLWMELDQLIQQGTEADLVLIDEAASVPIHHLETMLRRFPRIAMATTVHGYEGSGRGFLLRFRQSLDRLTRGWRMVELREPIRWRQGDPLEQQIDQLLMLSAYLPEVKQTDTPVEIRILSGSGAELAQDEKELNTVFSLLVAAHYRTRPSDLKQLLDDPQVVVYRLQTCTTDKFKTVGVLVGLRETAPDLQLSQAIAIGDRRPPGHVVAEILANQMGVENAVRLNLLRIQRIVIHPGLRRSGLGTRLLQQFCDDHSNSFSLVGTNFSVDPELISFWRQAGFSPVRLGSRHSPSSGTVSGLFVRALDEPGRSICSAAVKSFARELPATLPRTHRRRQPAIIHALLWRNLAFNRSLDSEAKRLLDRFAQSRLPEQALTGSLVDAVLSGLATGTLTDQQLCIERVLQGREWSGCEALAGDEGRVNGERRLRRSCCDLLQSLERKTDTRT